jgi:hypothetical protein
MIKGSSAIRPCRSRQIAHKTIGSSPTRVAAERPRTALATVVLLSDRFRAGIVLYAGEQQLSFGDRLTALPMAALWMLGGSAS